MTLNIPGTVSNKPYDGTTSATLTTNSSGVVQLGNSITANGSLADPSTFGPTGVLTSGEFTSSLPGLKTVNLANALLDTANYSLAGGSTLTTTAEILGNSNAQTVISASVSTGYILQSLTTSGTTASSALASADSAPSKATTKASTSTSSQGSSGSSPKEDQKGASASPNAGTVSVTPSPSGDVPIPGVPIIALTD